LKNDVLLRDVRQSDLPIFFKHQLDPDANQMAAFPPRDWEAFIAHWTDKVLSDETVTAKTILHDEQVAGNIVSWNNSGQREVGYWIGKEYWGKGIATRALSAFLLIVKERPLFAHVAKHNIASLRILQKCGFRISGEDTVPLGSEDERIEEFVLTLAANEIDNSTTITR